MNPFGQETFDIRFDWGKEGLLSLAPRSEVLVIVDVLSFSTCVSVAVDRGARIYPYPWKDERAAAFARDKGARLAGPRGQGLSLSPKSLLQLNPGEDIVLPSPNGSELSTLAGQGLVLTGCLRNATATAKAALEKGRTISVIAAGERWEESGALRPALEDLLGAGAILRALSGAKSPEAQAAEAAFLPFKDRLPETLAGCASGLELISRGFPEDVDIAAGLDSSAVAAVLEDGSYRPLRLT